MSERDVPEYIGDGHVQLEPGWLRLYPHRGWDSEFARGVRPATSFAWIVVHPNGTFGPWPQRRWLAVWLHLRGKTLYDGDGRRLRTWREVLNG